MRVVVVVRVVIVMGMIVGLAGSIGKAAELPHAAALKKLQALDAREIQRNLDRELQWHRQTLVQAFDRVGTHHAKADEAARQALDLAAQFYAADPARPGDAPDRLPDLLTAATGAGCHDPLVIFLQRKFGVEYGHEVEGLANLQVAATQLEHSAYPAYWRALALILAVNAPGELPTQRQPAVTEQDKAQSSGLLDRATALLPEVLRDESIPDRPLRILVVELVRGRKRVGVDRWTAYEAILPMLTKARRPDAAVLPLIKGVVLTDYAWDARGHAYINKVPLDHQLVFETGMGQSDAALSDAITKGTTDQGVGVAMMRVVLIVGETEQESTDWFEVARKIAPGSFEPYNARRNELLPRWGGSDEALLVFGREAFRQQHWGSRAPLELVETHQWIAKGPPEKKGYMARADVCADIKSVYDTLLAKYPGARTDRSRYARRLMTCKAWREADEQFRRLGDRPALPVFGGMEKFEAERALVAKRLAASTASSPASH